MIREFIQSANRPWEIAAMLKLKLASRSNGKAVYSLQNVNEDSMSDIDYCYTVLTKVSRSFAAVIQQLPVKLRDDVCIFYLVLRGLDSIEDDADFPLEQKIQLLKSFHKKNHQRDWKIQGVGDTPDYQALLANYDKVSRAYLNLEPGSREIIDRICREMGKGMAEFVEKKIGSHKDYDLYCYYVAGLVGVGLSELFASTGVEGSALRDQPDLSISMGLFLQKTNIIRDYHEDLHSDRVFWPEQVWRRYGNELKDFEKNPESKKSLACLNALVVDAMRHAVDSLKYLKQVEDERIFRFCAIPQAMAMATLYKIYNNPDVFTGVVKIRKGLAAMMLVELDDYKTISRYFNYFAKAMLRKVDKTDRRSQELRMHLHEIINTCSTTKAKSSVKYS